MVLNPKNPCNDCTVIALKYPHLTMKGAGMSNRRIRVLHVDDVEEEFILVCALLSDVKGIDFQLQWAPDIRTAMQTIQDKDFDVCIVDCYMGQDNGLDFIRDAMAQGIEIPFILMSGQKNPAITRQAMELGVRQFVDKNDITTSILLKAIQKAAEKQE